MKRNLKSLTEKQYDIVVIGGGIFGISLAWDAIRRGLSVALLEKGDFSHATSANSFKIVHGGIRYLQHGDFYRIRESSRERRALLRIAPHLVHPLPIVIPTFGRGKNGKGLLRLGVFVYDLAVLDRNKGLSDPLRRIPRGRGLKRDECLELFPGLNKEGLTGGVLFHDAQIYNPPRLALSILRSAVLAGAEAANYMEVTELLREGDRVVGVKARDKLSCNELEVRGKFVIGATGPWTEELLAKSLGARLEPPLTFSRDACFVVKKKLLPASYGLAVLGKTRDPDSVLSRSHRHLFIVPWRHYTLVGVWHRVYRGPTEEFTVTPEELQSFIEEITSSYSNLGLELEDVSTWNAGLVLFGENQPGQEDLSYGKRSLIIDHSVERKLEGLLSVVGVRFTTARGIAKQAIDLVFKKIGKRPPRSDTEVTPVHGGEFESLDELRQGALRTWPSQLSPEVVEPLLKNYGSRYSEVLEHTKEDPTLCQTLGATTTLKAEIVHAVREEMALKLGDVLFRRTDVATGENPGIETIRESAAIMGSELGWTEQRRRGEEEEVAARFPDLSGTISEKHSSQSVWNNR